MLATVLLVLGLVALLLMILSIIGLDFGEFDVDFGDSGVGLISVLSPFIAGLGIIGGGLMTFGSLGILWSLLIGLGVGVVFAAVSFAILGYLVGSEEEVPTVDMIGRQVRVVEPLSPGRIGSGEVKTPLGTQIISIVADAAHGHNEYLRITGQVEGRNVFSAEQLPFDTAPE